MNTYDDYFVGSPFSVVPERGAIDGWAASDTSLAELQRMLLRLKGAASSLDLVWATFGSGKTHALLYLEKQLIENSAAEAKPTCVYFELHDGARSFLSLYSGLADALEWDVVLGRIATMQIGAGLPADLRRIANLYLNGSAAERDVALRWLRGEKIHLAELRRLANVARRI